MELVRVERAHSDFAIAGVAAFTGFAAGSALGVPWELQAPPSDSDVLEMSGRQPDFLAAEWGVDVQLAVCVAEVAAHARLDSRGSLDVLATRIIAWYRSNPVQVPLEVQGVLQWTLDPSLAPSHLRAGLIAAGCGSGSPKAGAMRAAARARHQSRRLSARVPGNELLPLMVPVALWAVSDVESCTRAALGVTSLLSASPQVAAADVAYALLLRGTIEAAVRGRNWRECVDWDRAAADAVRTISDARLDLFGDSWEDVDAGAVASVLSSVRPPRGAGSAGEVPGGAGASAGFAAGTGAGLDAVSALDRVLAAVDAARWELERNPSLNPVRVGVEGAVRSGGDTDTVAALVGALLGGACGPTAIPPEWTRSIWGWPGLRQDGLRDLATGCVYSGLAQAK
ncbi:MAG: ADP-ribosylglycohydrolase family protein [Actinomycetaceae bacterium]|nr:ADP-ribosylglycohydrolase family protein [Actinomycetaceae bacterium]